MNRRGCTLTRLFTPSDVFPPVITDAEQPVGPARQLDEWRNELVTSRANIVGKPGVYSDRSATGAGKSAADIEAVKLANRALIVVPVHENCEEVESDMQAAGINAMKYPGRLVDGDDINCWNGDVAKEAEAMGLSVVAAVCPLCHRRQDCSQYGYLAQIQAVNAADVAISTHARAIANGLNKLASGRSDFVAIHEDSIGVMCPEATLSIQDLESADLIIDRILNDPRLLDWLGQSAKRDEDGNLVPDEKLAERRTAIYEFICHIASMIVSIREQSGAAIKTAAINLPVGIKKATGTDSFLFRVSLEIEVRLSGGWKLLLAAAAGELYSLAVIIDDSPTSGKQAKDSPMRKVVYGTWRNIPTENTTLLFCDATADREDLETYIGRPVVEITPEGHLERAKRVVQFPKDVTRRTKPNRFLAIVRGVLSTFPRSQRVGIITHRTLVGYLSKIGEPFASRIVKSSYFGSGQDRASNGWYEICDLLAVIGTPRVNSMAIRQRLIQFGDFGPVAENPDWGDVFWRGEVESGGEVVITNRGYRHPSWNRAHRTLVRAAIIQATGRSRSLLKSGCDVAIVSTEECGFPLASESGQQVAETEMKAISFISNLSAQKLTTEELSAACAYISSKRTVPISSDLASLVPLASTTEIAAAIGLKERRTRVLLAGMESRDLVIRIGERGRWTLGEVGRLIAAIEQGGQSA